VGNHRIHRIKEHLYTGLAIMDLVAHIEELDALWRRDSVAYAMRLAFQEWKAADDLLCDMEENLQDSSGGGPHASSPTAPGKEGPTEEPLNGTHQP
jgi:hypothetical protein